MGAELTLNCTAAGNPTPVYNWQSSHPMKETMEDRAVLVSSSLLPGTYTCTASNTLEKRSKMFIVKTKNEGKIFKQILNMQVFAIFRILILILFY